MELLGLLDLHLPVMQFRISLTVSSFASFYHHCEPVICGILSSPSMSAVSFWLTLICLFLQVLLKPIVSQLVVEPPASLEEYASIPSLKEVDDLLVTCVGQMAVTAGTDLLWKPLNHEVSADLLWIDWLDAVDALSCGPQLLVFNW